MTKRHHILVAEDDDIFRKRLSKALIRRGYTVVEADSVVEALRIIAEESEILFAVIDLRIGTASGLDILPHLFSRSPHCRAIILTAYGTIATSVSAIKNGACHYLTKPVDIDVIVACLRDDLTEAPNTNYLTTPSLEQNEWEYINRVIGDCNGNISAAAKLLGLHRRTLQRKLSKLPLRIS
jgi:two-component system response regulator RegA